jgi:hypothetical protein
VSPAPLGLARHRLAAEKATLEQSFGSVRLWDGRLFVLDAIARNRGLASEVAARARTRGRLARVTEVGSRGVMLGDGERASNVWAVWTSPALRRSRRAAPAPATSTPLSRQRDAA